ncbi:MAG: oligosaccharide flippase family protein, partial [Clostridia bacterium]|nr:oligosaccharide flippase family protein [Clostridia bacterium]
VSIKSKAVKSAKWTTANSVVNMVYGPIYKILLAMIISPTDFAYIAAIAVVLNLGDMLNKIGFSQALIVEEKTDFKQFSSVLWLDAFMSLIVGVAIVFCSSFVERYYQLENLSSMILVVAPCVLFSGLARTFRCYLQRELRVDIITRIDMLKLILDSTFSIVMILVTKSIFGYVIGTLIGSFSSMTCMMLCAFKHGYKIKFCIDFKLIKKIWNFAGFVTLRQVFDYIMNVADELLIARLFSDKSVLGFYYFAKDLISKPQGVITSAVSQVALSTVAKFSNDLKQVGNLYLTMTKFLAVVSFPVFAGLAVTAGEFVPLLFGSEYLGAVIYVQLFCIRSIFATYTLSPTSAVLYAIKKPNRLFAIDLANNIPYVILLLILGRFGMGWIMAVIMFRAFCVVLMSQIVTMKSIMLSIRKYLSELKVTFVATIMMVIGVFAIQTIIPDSASYLIELVASVAVGAVVYTVIMLKLEKSLITKLLGLLKKG